MMLTKYLGVALLLSASALSLAQDTIKIEPKWDKDFKLKLTTKGEIEVGGMTAKLESTTSWTAKPSDDGTTLTVHHDNLVITANDMDVPVPFNDFVVNLNKSGSLTKVEGGVDGTDTVRWFLSTTFFAPTKEVKKDEVVKWEIAADTKLELGARKIETTYLGEAMVGKVKAFKFKQTMKETTTEFSTDGTLWVTAAGHVLKADINFAGMPIPAAGGEGKGKFTITSAE